MKLIVGLGNPGEKYKYTRHNVGFLVLDEIIKLKNLGWQENKKFKSLVVKDGNIIYLKPQTYMNNSGQAVQSVLYYYQLLPKKKIIPSWLGGPGDGLPCNLSEILTVIHDDIDIDLGKYKISDNSGSAGHKGVESIIQYLKTKKFTRYRIGIKGVKPEQIPTEKYVLENFKENEKLVIDNIIHQLKL